MHIRILMVSINPFTLYMPLRCVCECGSVYRGCRQSCARRQTTSDREVVGSG